MKQRKAKKRTIYVALGIFVLVVLLIAGSYAWLTLSLTGEKKHKIVAGELSLLLDETSAEGIALENAVPEYDTDGVKHDAYTFTLTNNGSVTSEYTIFLDDLALENSEIRFPDEALRYHLTIDQAANDIEALPALHKTGYQVPKDRTGPVRVLDSGTIAPNETKAYEFHLWIGKDFGNEVMGKVFRARLRIEGTQTGIE